MYKEVYNIISLEDWKRRRTPLHETAEHEAFHEVGGYNLSNVEITGVSVKPEGLSLGRTSFVLYEADPKRWFVKRVALAHMSLPGERKMSNFDNAGCNGDQSTIEALRLNASFIYGDQVADALIAQGRSLAESIVSQTSINYIIERSIQLAGPPLDGEPELPMAV